MVECASGFDSDINGRSIVAEGRPENKFNNLVDGLAVLQTKK